MKLEPSKTLFRTLSALLLIALLPVGTVNVRADEGFVSWNEESSVESVDAVSLPDPEPHGNLLSMAWKYGSLGLMGLFMFAGVLAVRFPRLLRLRPLVLLLTLAVVGVFLGGCPCPIKGVQSPFAWLGGATHIHWLPLGGFLVILLSSYFFGPTFCGWGCPLGALQEFLFLKRNAAPPSDQMRQIMLWIRRGSALLLAIWLVVTGTIFWEEVDPFKAIFTFQIFNVTTWVLVGVLLLSSIYLFRPFCRLFCPVGLLNGVISRLPGASGPQIRASCNSCLRCSKACKMGALSNPDHIIRELCIGCGDCLSHCKNKSLVWGKASLTR